MSDLSSKARRPCPVGTCGRTITPGVMVCGRHFRSIPRDDREVLAAAFRRRVDDPAGYALACELVVQAAELHDPDRLRLVCA